MKILILGCDGYLGWPTAMYFSSRDNEVCGVDNYFRRDALRDLGCESLVQNPDLEERAAIWREKTGRTIAVRLGDVTDYSFLLRVFREFRPEVVIHYAEQPSAPYSMMDREKAAFTVRNNLIGTLNVVHAVGEIDRDCHIIKLGTMGEYGTPNIDIEEGWLEIHHKGRSDTFLFPRQASSLYHTTKIQDTDLLWFYVRTWNLRVTDLMQGPVYGIATGESSLDEALTPSFQYDEIFGTVLNRFVVQSVCGHPLTVYGTGGQVRGFINLVDSLQCVYLAATHPPERGSMRIFNQVTETFSILELAKRVRRVAGEAGYPGDIELRENPRVEQETHYYNPSYSGFAELGLEPHLLTDEVLREFLSFVAAHSKRINRSTIVRGVTWK